MACGSLHICTSLKPYFACNLYYSLTSVRVVFKQRIRKDTGYRGTLSTNCTFRTIKIEFQNSILLIFRESSLVYNVFRLKNATATRRTPCFSDSTCMHRAASPNWRNQYSSSSLFIRLLYIRVFYCFYNVSDFYFALRLRFNSPDSYCCCNINNVKRVWDTARTKRVVILS